MISPRKILSVLFSLFLSISFCESANPDLRLNTIVIDAGHGGKDAGTVSRDKKTYEKNLTLKIARKFSERIKAGYPAMKVVMTRETDVFVPLMDRTVKASGVNAQLFISIHINAAARSTAPNGFSAYILGPAKKSSYDSYEVNMEALQRENSVIYLEEDYSTKYQGFEQDSPESEIFLQLMQSAFREQSLLLAENISESMSQAPFRKNWGVMQGNFCVLRQASMPAVLLEFGFMSNPDDLAMLRSEKNIDSIVDKLYDAFSRYKTVYDSSVTLDVAESPMFYGILVLSSCREMSQNDPFFKGEDVIAVNSGNQYNYILDFSSNIDEVKSKFINIRKKFPDACLVRINGETIERF